MIQKSKPYRKLKAHGKSAYFDTEAVTYIEQYKATRKQYCRSRTLIVAPLRELFSTKK